MAGARAAARAKPGCLRPPDEVEWLAEAGGGPCCRRRQEVAELHGCWPGGVDEGRLRAGEGLLLRSGGRRRAGGLRRLYLATAAWPRAIRQWADAERSSAGCRPCLERTCFGRGAANAVQPGLLAGSRDQCCKCRKGALDASFEPCQPSLSASSQRPRARSSGPPNSSIASGLQATVAMFLQTSEPGSNALHQVRKTNRVLGWWADSTARLFQRAADARWGS